MHALIVKSQKMVFRNVDICSFKNLTYFSHFIDELQKYLACIFPYPTSLHTCLKGIALGTVPLSSTQSCFVVFF